MLTGINNARKLHSGDAGPPGRPLDWGSESELDGTEIRE